MYVCVARGKKCYFFGQFCVQWDEKVVIFMSCRERATIQDEIIKEAKNTNISIYK